MTVTAVVFEPSNLFYYISLLDPKRPIEFPELFAVVRLAHKYNIEEMLGQALHILKLFYTTSFRQYERESYSHVNFVRPKLVHHIGAVNLARLTNTPSMLPLALYHCCGLSGSVIDGWKRGSGETEYLSMQDIKALIDGRDDLSGRGFAMLLNILDPYPAQGCTQPSLCGISLASLVRSVERDSVGDYAMLDGWATEIKRLARELEICRRCRNAVLKRDVAERREVWEQLPSIFGLSEAECRWNAPVAGDDSSSDSGNDWA